MQSFPSVSVVICTLSSAHAHHVEALITDIKQQTLLPQEIVIVRGARPRTLAHNRGVQAAQGGGVVFFDDDVRLGNREVIARMVEALYTQPNAGIVGAAILPPTDATPFQKRCAQELLRGTVAVVREAEERGVISHAAMAIRRDVYQEAGGEDEELYLNDDALLSYRVYKKGYRLFLAPHAWVYHPAPASIGELLKKSFFQGRAQAHDMRKCPSLLLEIESNLKESVIQTTPAGKIKRNSRIIMYALLGGRFLLLFSRVATGVGFLIGMLSFSRQEALHGSVETRSLSDGAGHFVV